MSNAENFEVGFEHHLPQWEALDGHVRQRIASTSAMIEMADRVVSDHELVRLNQFLRDEQLLGIPMQVKTGLPTFLHKVLTEDGVSEEPALDAEFMKKTSFEGVFKGCAVMELQSESLNLLFYEIEVPKGDGTVTLRAPVDASKVKVEYPEGEGWEKEADGAFSILETVENEDYLDAVKELSTAFWNTDQPPVIRLRTIGLFATELLSYKEHIESKELSDALSTILLCSLDEDMTYVVKGFHVDESREKDGRAIVDIKHSTIDRIMKPVGVRYITNFEVLEVNGGDVDVQLGDTKQPAFTFYDTRQRVELDYPMRYIAHIEEHEHDEFYSLTKVQRIGEGGVNRVARMEDGETCGEWSQRYSQDSANGV